MTRAGWLAALMFAGTMAFARGAFALDCGTSLITEGDSREHLIEACGPPTRRSGGETYRSRYGTGQRDEVLTYDFGPTRDVAIITLRAGRIIAIRMMGRGAPR